MGRLVDKAATGVENNLGVFSYNKSSFNGCPYMDDSKKLPGRWNGKQLGGQTPHKAPCGNRARGVPSCSQDCLFEPGFKRLFEGDGLTKCQPDHLPPINTMETNRLKEKIKMELMIAQKSASSERLSTATGMLETSRRESMSRLAETPAPVYEANDMRSRKYRPTASAAIGARHNNHYTSMYNANMYAPGIAGMPAAYINKHSHAPLIMGMKGSGFFRKNGSINPAAPR